jgi:hypothetical protein
MIQPTPSLPPFLPPFLPSDVHLTELVINPGCCSFR